MIIKNNITQLEVVRDANSQNAFLILWMRVSVKRKAFNVSLICFPQQYNHTGSIVPEQNSRITNRSKMNNKK